MSIATLVDAVTIGAIYALVALGFTVVFAPTKVLNFAQGEFIILGAATAFQLQAVWGWSPLVVIVVAIVLAIVLSSVLERMVMLPVRLSGSSFAWIIATLAAAMIFESGFRMLFPSALLKADPLVGGAVTVLGTSIKWQSITVVVGAILIMAVYDQFMKRTIHGQAIRAVAHDPDTATLMGVSVGRVVWVSFVIAGVITTMAGILAAPTIFIEPSQGLSFTIKGFTAAVIGGLGSARGALLGGVVVGLLDTVLRNSVSAGIGNIAVVGMLALILVVFPSGLLGQPVEGH